MSNEGLLYIPYRGGFDSDDPAHRANVRAIEGWARAPKGFWSLIDLGTLPDPALYADGALVFVADVFYGHSNGAWVALGGSGATGSATVSTIDGHSAMTVVDTQLRRLLELILKELQDARQARLARG